MRINSKLITLFIGGISGPVFASGITIETVTSDITVDTVWDSDTNNDGVVDKIYFLDKAVSVKTTDYGSGWAAGDDKVTLTIEPGTVIAGTGSDAGSSGAEVGALLVTRSGKLDAQGTADSPIVFTSASQAEYLYDCDVDGDEFTNTFELSPVDNGGEWGGVIVLGNAPINYTSGSANVGETSIEGFPAGSSSDIVYGGDVADDNSGILEYIRIEFGGFKYSADDEINGLTLGGVGSGTTVRYIEVVGNTDDGFEFFGGTVSTSHLISFYNQDEAFDFDEGHQGTHQFLFAVQSTLSDNGTEADGGNGDTKTLEPFSLTKIYNATYIGGGANSATGAHGFRLKENFAGQFHNSIFHDYAGSVVRMDDQVTEDQVGVNLIFTNNVLGSFVGGASTGDNATGADALLALSGNSAVGTDPQLTTLVRTSDEVSSIDPRPVLGGPAWTGDLTAGAPAPTKFKGAFGAQNWAAGWSFMSESGYLADDFSAPAVTVETVTGDITADTTWDSDTNDDGVVDKIYFLDQAVSVKAANYGGGWEAGDSKVTLTIEPGTIIAGTGSDAGSSGAEVGALLVTRSGMINAQGEENCPIIFTSASQAEYIHGVDVDGDEFVNTFELSPIENGGEWGGVILLGSAPINYASGSENVGETSIEGFPAGSSSDIVYGGENPDDSSGIMEYVRIEFGGFKYSADDEINGLTLGGVGSGTTVRYIEVVGNTDDGFEFFGGTVNTSYLVSLFNQDEAFDMDEGHQGTHQFWYAVQSTLSDNGTEADGGNGSIKTLHPFTLSKIYNATYIGGGEDSQTGAHAFRLKENFAGQFHNSIFHDYAGSAVRMDDQNTEDQVGVNLIFNNNIFGSFVDGAVAGDNATGATALLALAGNTSVGTDPELIALAREAGDVVAIDPRPTLTSPAYGTDLSLGGLKAAPYRGAFGHENWTKTWTYMSENGYSVDAELTNQFNLEVTVELVTGDITADTTWDSDTNGDGLVDKIYFLSNAVAVKDPAYGSTWAEGDSKVTLTIEPGTVIAGTGSDAGSSGAEVGALLITRSGMIDAEGTANSPIIFTSASQAEYVYGVDVDGDEFVNDFQLSPVDNGGEWGGVIVLGNAPINYTSGSVNVGETSIEGFPAGSSSDIVYGGNTSNDSSGIMKFVRIEFGGFKYSADDEINGLTLGGVGSGTSVSYIEVVGNTDDGFEFFGGTVDTTHLVSFFNQDESFDMDEGHQGVHQFWFAAQSTLSDNGTEADGGNGDSKTGTPLTSTQVYNATYIGGGANSATGAHGFRLKENFAGQFHNSIFHDYAGSVVRMDDQITEDQVGGNLLFEYNIFGDFVGGAATGDNATGATALVGQAGNSAVGTDPLLSVLFRTNDDISLIDPRPALAGPAWGTTLRDGAPTEVEYRGAFGTSNWAHTWTYMSNNGYFNPCFSETEVPEAMIVVEGGEGLEIVSFVPGATAGTYDITFTSVDETTYKVTGSPDLVTAFGDLETDIDGTGNDVTVNVAVPGGAATTRYFFRVVEQ